MTAKDLDAFTPVQGRNVVYGFRNPIAWEQDPDNPGGVRLKADFADLPFLYRPAQIVKVWTRTDQRTANLVVFLDGGNDSALGNPNGDLVVWKTSAIVGTDEVINAGREHYLPRAPEGYEGQ